MSIVMLCSVTVTSDSLVRKLLRIFTCFYHFSELLSGCFNHTTYGYAERNRFGLGFVREQHLLCKKVNLAWMQYHLTCDSIRALVVYAAVRCCSMQCAIA